MLDFQLNTELTKCLCSFPPSVCQVRTVWLHGTELHGAEEAPDSRGLVGEVGVQALEVEEEEVGEDLRGASSVVEEGGADTFAPSPGEFTWAMAAAIRGRIWTNLDIINTVSMETGLDDVVTTTYRLCVDVLCFVIMSCSQRIKVRETKHRLLC